MNKFTVGCDPEIFLKKSGGFIASCGLVGGSKQSPLQLENLPEGFNVQEDNVAVEFGVPPAIDKFTFTQNIHTIMEELTGLMLQKGLSLGNESSALFPKEELWHPNALTFGCDPDFNIWTERKNPRPRAADETLRSCGGHVHVGLEKGYNWRKLVKTLDLYLGVPSVLLDDDARRKELYGQSGAFRKKPYGIEYRTLSNFWVFKPELTEWVWDAVEQSVNAVDAQFPIEELQEPIQTAINTNNKELALTLVNKYNLPYVKELSHV